VRTTAGLDGGNPLGWERVVPDEKLRIFLRENVVGHDRDVMVVAKETAQRQ
jgi:hypothetical protein